MSDTKGVLVVALQQHGVLAPAVYELLSAGRKLSDELKEPLCAVVLGAKTEGSAQDLIARGADKVFVVENEALAHFSDEAHAQAVKELVEKEKFGKVILPSSVIGRSLAARLAVGLKAGLAADVSEMSLLAGRLAVKRSMYSGNVVAEVEFKSPVEIVMLSPMAWPRAEAQAGRSGETVPFSFSPSAAKVQFVSFQAEESKEIDLGAAERIVSGGRGLGSAEGFKLVRDFAHLIKAAVGASRAVVDSGWIAYRHQVGLTGRAVRPKLYVACGISGQIQHLAGMSSSGTIVAFNTDPDCPMMQIATISVVGDMYELIPLVLEEIKKRKGAPVAA